MTLKTLRKSLKPLASHSRVEQVAERVRDYIGTEKLQPGDRLPGELAIAEALQVSRPVLREAIGRLESLGLVHVKRGSGTYVANRDHLGSCVDFLHTALAISPQDLLHYAELRTVIECFAASKVAGQITSEGLAELISLCDEIDREDQEYVDAVRADFRFHQKIVELSGNVLMRNLIEVLHGYIMAGMVHTTPQPRNRPRSRAIHAAILEAIRKGDSDAAEQAMKRHMDAVIERLLAAEVKNETRKPC